MGEIWDAANGSEMARENEEREGGKNEKEKLEDSSHPTVGHLDLLTPPPPCVRPSLSGLRRFITRLPRHRHYPYNHNQSRYSCPFPCTAPGHGGAVRKGGDLGTGGPQLGHNPRRLQRRRVSHTFGISLYRSP